MNSEMAYFLYLQSRTDKSILLTPCTFTPVYSSDLSKQKHKKLY